MEKQKVKVRFVKIMKVNIIWIFLCLIEKNGMCNIEFRIIRGKNICFMSDIFIIFLEM